MNCPDYAYLLTLVILCVLVMAGGLLFAWMEG